METHIRKFLTHSLGAMMRRLSTILPHDVIAWSLALALAFFPAIASAQLSGGLMFPGPGMPAASASYTGPIDINGAAFALWSTRCSSNSYTGNVADIWDSATGSTTETLLTCSVGGVLNQTIHSLATTCASGCKVKTLYDQSGASKCSAAVCDLVEAANATRPTVTTSCQNSKICLVFNGSACMATANTVTTQAQPYTVSAVWTTTTYR
jgi:hypothetical protein